MCGFFRTELYFPQKRDLVISTRSPFEEIAKNRGSKSVFKPTGDEENK